MSLLSIRLAYDLFHYFHCKESHLSYPMIYMKVFFYPSRVFILGSNSYLVQITITIINSQKDISEAWELTTNYSKKYRSKDQWVVKQLSSYVRTLSHLKNFRSWYFIQTASKTKTQPSIAHIMWTSKNLGSIETNR